MQYLLNESFYFAGEKSIVLNERKSCGYSCWDSCVFSTFCSCFLKDCACASAYNYIYKLEI